MTGRTLWLAALAVAVVFVAGCSDAPVSSAGNEEATKTALDEGAGVLYKLTGDRLHVEVLPDAPRIEDLFLGRGDLTFRCTDESYGSLSDARAEAKGQFSPESREVTLTLSADVSENAVLCFVQADGAVESIAWFRSPEELYGFDQPSDAEQEANAARARAATDCVEFTKEVREELTGGPGPAELLEPGMAPSVPIHAYWFGPRLDERRAILAGATIEPDWDEAENEVRVPHYWVAYQVPEDGCLNSALDVSSDEDFGYYPGRELQVLSMPADAPTVRLYLRDPDVLGNIEPLRTHLANGEAVSAYPGSVMGFAVLTETTFVVVPGKYGRLNEMLRLLPLLRPVGG